MNIKSSFILALVAVSMIPLSAGAKKTPPNRGMLEKMEAVSCGAKQRGITGLGAVWASAGITHVNSMEKLCPQYLLRTDEMEYEIRPMAGHAVVLPIGQEAEFKIAKDRMILRIPDADDRKTRDYEVVSVKPTNSNNDAPTQSSKAPDKSSDRASTEKSADKASADQSPNKASSQP